MARVFLSILLTISTTHLCLGALYNVINYRAKPDGITDSTDAFQRAWNDACACSQQATFYIPKGSFLVNQITFQGPCKNSPLLFQIDGTIVSPQYVSLPKGCQRWLHFHQINGININGGVLDGSGKSLWDCKKSDKNCPDGAVSLQVSNCQHVNIASLTSMDSQFFHMHVFNSEHVTLESVIIKAPWNSPNTDGIHVSLSNDVHISNSNIATGDDCISIGHGTTNLWIENINCGPGHGISIGSLGKDSGESKVQNVTVTGCTFSETQNGVRIKTVSSGYDGYVNQIKFQHNTMNNVQNPIIIDQHYCNGKAQACPGGSKVKINNVSYIDIHGTSRTPFGVNFNCSETNPCSGLFMESINIQNGKSSCVNSYGVSMGAINPPCCLGR